LSICFPSLINKKVGIACTSHSAITSCTNPVAQSLQIFNPLSTFTNKLDTTSHLHHQTLPASTLFYKQRTHPHNGTHDTHFRCKSLGNLPEECQDIPLFPMLFNTPNPKEIKEQYKKLTATSSTSTLRKIKDV
jgi:hypothetical protein